LEKPIALALTGASGAQYGLRLLKQLLVAGKTVYCMVSRPALAVLHAETDWRLPAAPRAMEAELQRRFAGLPGSVRVFGHEDWFAPVASGSNPPAAMVVCPCSSATLAAIAHGTSRSLIERAADVMIKEHKPLILVHRETPLSVIHLENALRLARLGVIILPANPGFYQRPQRIEDVVDFIVARILDHLDIAHTLLPRWGGKDS